MPHLATTYAAVNTLVTLGTERALSSINRYRKVNYNSTHHISFLVLSQIFMILLQGGYAQILAPDERTFRGLQVGEVE
jgi:hypothetical protein